MEDGRRVDIAFVDQGNETKVIETFDAESSNPVEFQQAGWQAIMDNFKAYTQGETASAVLWRRSALHSGER